LNNRAYIGQREINKENKSKDQDLLKLEDRYNSTKAVWPAIVDPEIFISVQSTLEKNYRSLRRHDHVHLLSKKIICGECGEILVGVAGTGRSGEAYHLLWS
jgi:hypothetical protein